VLATWAALFWFLLGTGRTSLYLSTRTAWLVPVGAVLLTVAALGRLATARTAHADHLTPRETWVLGVIALPVVLFMALPPATLGSYSVNRRPGIGASVRIVSGPLDFVDVGAAQSFDAANQQLQARAGETIELEGFVTTDASLPPGEFLLSRYIVTCCVADATVAQVRVVGAPSGTIADDEWVHVSGAVYPLGREVLVAADVVDQIPVPDSPYLTP
jgi:putative membrane protein